MTIIYLLRHGALAGDNGGRFIGQIDLPLAAEGVSQAQALGQALRGCNMEAIHCSDLLRSRQTAAIVAEATAVAVEAHQDLREISLGEWEGLARREVAARFPAEFAARGRDLEHYRVPSGESFADCRRRAAAAWKAILAGGRERIAIVGHAGVNRLLLGGLLGMDATRMFDIGQDYGCVNVIEQEGGIARVRLVNGRAEDLAAAG